MGWCPHVRRTYCAHFFRLKKAAIPQSGAHKTRRSYDLCSLEPKLSIICEPWPFGEASLGPLTPWEAVVPVAEAVSKAPQGPKGGDNNNSTKTLSATNDDDREAKRS
jgi:hypothetical protein